MHISYSVIDKWITLNSNEVKYAKLKDVIEALNGLGLFTVKYYLYLLKKEDMKKVFEKIKYFIISFFIDQNKNDIIDEKTLILLLQESPDDDFTSNFFDKIETKILKEEDFYTKEKTRNFEFFQLYLENIYNKFEEKLEKGYSYVLQSMKTKSKILNDLKNKNVQYKLMKNLISDDNIIFEKIKVLTNNDKDEAEKIYQGLKDSIEKRKEKFHKLELINDYYNQFYKVTKKDQINLIKNKLTELYNMKISCILEEDNFFKDDNSFDYYEALEDCKKIKYR